MSFFFESRVISSQKLHVSEFSLSKNTNVRLAECDAVSGTRLINFVTEHELYSVIATIVQPNMTLLAQDNPNLPMDYLKAKAHIKQVESV
jgi:hypothetical protein